MSPVRALLHVEHQAALVAVVGLEVRGILAALVGSVRIAAGTFYLDDIRTEVGEHHSATGSCDEGPLLHDANA